MDFTIPMKSQEITEINRKSSHNAYEMYKFMNICILMKKKTGKNYRVISKKLIFGQTYTKFDGCHGDVKNYGHEIHISKVLQRMNKTATESLSPLE